MSRASRFRIAAIVGAALTASTLGARPARAATPAAVTYYRAATVAASFAKGGILFDQGTNYMIHTSRRVSPGMVEVHEKDTDLIYVMQGSAQFVTGGTMVGGAPIGPGEIRGTDIQGGESRILSPGDVIIVPNGVPHWFKQLQGPLLYYTIKVR